MDRDDRGGARRDGKRRSAAAIAMLTISALAIAVLWALLGRGSSRAPVAPPGPGAGREPAHRADPDAARTPLDADSRLGSSADPTADEDAAPPAEAEGAVLLALDPEGHPLADCRILRRLGSLCETLGMTGAEGTLDVKRESVAGAWLAARHPRFAQGDVVVPDPAPERVVLRLGPAGHLGGVVRLPDGGVPHSPLEVLAIPLERIPRIASESQWSDTNPGFARVAVAADGTFDVPGLRPGARYSLRAGGPGWVSLENVLATAPRDDVELTVHPLFGARVRVRDEQGMPLAHPPDLARDVGHRILYYDPEAEPARGDTLDLLLAGAPLDTTRRSPWEFPVLLCGPEDVESLRPTLIEFAVPGYVEQALSVPMPRFRGEFRDVEIRLAREARGWTELSIFWEGGPRIDIEDTRQIQSDLSLDLIRSDGKRYRIALARRGIRDVETHRLPAGRYRWALLAQRARFPAGDAFEEASWEGPRDTLRLPWPEGSGALRIDLELASGLPAEGPWKLFLRDGDRAGAGYFVRAFTGSPALLCAVPAGSWHLFAATGLAPPPGVGARTTEVTVRAGECVAVRLLAETGPDPALENGTAR